VKVDKKCNTNASKYENRSIKTSAEHNNSQKKITLEHYMT